MSRLPRRPTTEMTDPQRQLFERMAEGRSGVTDGHIGGPFDAWGLNPDTGLRQWQLGGALRFKSGIDRRHIELAILVTGQFWQAQYEWYAHEPMARDAGVPEEVIQAIKAGTDPQFSDPMDEACYRFCHTLHRDRNVDEATYLAAVAHFREAGVAEMINTCGFYTMVSMTLNTFQVDLPEGVQPPFGD